MGSKVPRNLRLSGRKCFTLKFALKEFHAASFFCSPFIIWIKRGQQELGGIFIDIDMRYLGFFRHNVPALQKPVLGRLTALSGLELRMIDTKYLLGIFLIRLTPVHRCSCDTFDLWVVSKPKTRTRQVNGYLDDLDCEVIVRSYRWDQWGHMATW